MANVGHRVSGAVALWKTTARHGALGRKLFKGLDVSGYARPRVSLA